MPLGGVDQLLQAQVRRARWQFTQLRRFAEQVLQLVVEDQRQAGQCQHQ